MSLIRIKHITYSILVLFGVVFSCKGVNAQGKVIINEFMSSSGCSQYIELKNLGPGRENIGCYIIAAEKGAITIPPNTWLDPGDLYLIAGVPSLTNCPSSGSPIAPVNLNWTNCNGCSTPNMTTSTSFFGSRNSQDAMYPLVLFNSSATLTVIDAVAEGSIAKAMVSTVVSTTNTTSCTNRTVNLNTLSNSLFEDTGPAPGTNASASRKIDGSCEWNKSPNVQTPGFSNNAGGVTLNPIVVNTSYSMNCLPGDTYNATQTINITLTGISQYYLSTAYATDSTFSQSVSITSSTLQSQTSITLTAPSTLKPGYYNYLFEVTPGSSCDQKQLLFQMIDPIMTISPTYNFDCVGGTANFQLTNVGASNISAPYYFPISYSLYTMNSGVISSTYTSSTKSTPDFVNVSSLPAGDYRMTLTPSSAFACPKSIDFSVSTLPETSLTTTTTTEPACEGISNGRATIEITNDQIEVYYPITYILTNTTSSTVVETKTVTSSTIYLQDLPSANYSIQLDPYLNGCLTNNFSISVEPKACDPLKETLKKFTGKNIGSENEFNIEIDTDEVVEKIHLESSENGSMFKHVGNIPFENKKGMQTITYRTPATNQSFYRLELHDNANRVYNSSVIRITNQIGDIGIKTYPNPAGDHITFSKVSTRPDLIQVIITSLSGKILYQERFTIKTGNNLINIPTRNLSKGQYILSMYNVSTGDRQSSTIIK